MKFVPMQNSTEYWAWVANVWKLNAERPSQ